MKKKKDDFKTGIAVGQWLQEVGLMDHPSIRTKFNLALRSGDFSKLREYLRNHEQSVRWGKLRFQTKKMFEESNPFYPFPNQDDFTGSIPLGYINPTGDEFRISESDLVRHMLVIGRTGAGKSNFIKMLLTSIAATTNSVFWIFDQNREYRKIKHIFTNVLVLRVRDFWDNPFERPSNNIGHLDWLEVVSQIFEIELGFRLASKMLLIDTGKYIYRKRKILEGSESYPTCGDFFNVLRESQNSKKTQYQKDSLKPLIDRLQYLLSIGNYFQIRKSIPIRDLLNTNIIFEFDGATDEIYTFVMSLLLTKAFYYRMWNPHNYHTHVNIVEEGRVPFSNRRFRNFEFKEPVLNKLMAQYRKFGGSFIVLTQEPSSISSTPKANVHTIIAFPLSQGTELRDLQQTMLLSGEQLEYFRSLPIGTGLVMYGGMKPFLVDIPKFPKISPAMSDMQINEEAEAFLEKYREKKSSKEEVKINTEPADSSSKSDTNTTGALDSESMKVIYTLNDNPFLIYTELQSAVEFGASKFKKIATRLADTGYVVFEEIKVSKGRRSKFLVLTDKAYGLVDKPKKPKGKGSFKSKIFSHIIKKALEEDGWKAWIEGKTPHGDKLIDVLGYKESIGYVGYEVTNSFDNLIENVEQDFEKSKVSKVVIVTEDNNGLKRAKKNLAKITFNYVPKKIEYQLIKDFY